MTKPLTTLFDLGKRKEKEGNIINEGNADAKKGKHNNDDELMFPTEILSVISTHLSTQDINSLYLAHGINLNEEDVNTATKFPLVERGLFNGEPISIQEAKALFKVRAKEQYKQAKRLRDNYHRSMKAGDPPYSEVATNIQQFRAVEKWIYNVHLKLFNTILKRGETELFFNGTHYLSYLPLADLLNDEEVAPLLLQVTLIKIEYNLLSGPIPPEFGQLDKLECLCLNNNQFSGPIPPELGQLKNLKWLELTANQLSGPISPELGQLKNLKGLILNENKLSGPIPPELERMENLNSLNLSNNQLSGTISPGLEQLTNLSYLNLNENQLCGPIPSELGKLSNIKYLDFENNQFSGQIPAELGKLFKLKKLYFNENQLSGSIPSELGQLSKLTHLSLGGNQLSGQIPPELGQLSNLESLSLMKNLLSGPIPRELGLLYKLNYLYLAFNQLSGCIPSEFEELINNPFPSLSILHLENNCLRGHVSSLLLKKFGQDAFENQNPDMIEKNIEMSDKKNRI